MEERTFSPGNVKYDWYQTDSEVVVTVMIKGLSKDDCKIDFGDAGDVLNVSIRKETDSDTYEDRLRLNLSRYINAPHSSFRCFPSKIEVKMRKAEGGRWDRLESSTGVPSGPRAEPETDGPRTPLQDSNSSRESNVGIQAHNYPTSSTRGPKNWDKIEKQVKEEEEQEEKTGDTGVNHLFQQIYRDADDDVKKAMLKSFTESHGTVLSTNWSEVGKGKVDCKPPEGLEFKKYD